MLICDAMEGRVLGPIGLSSNMRSQMRHVRWMQWIRMGTARPVSACQSSVPVPRIPTLIRSVTSFYPQHVCTHPARSSPLTNIQHSITKSHIFRDMRRGRLPEYKLLQSADPQPGGAQIIVNNAGKDVSHLFKGIHPERTLELNLDESQRVGRLDDEGE